MKVQIKLKLTKDLDTSNIKISLTEAPRILINKLIKSLVKEESLILVELNRYFQIVSLEPYAARFQTILERISKAFFSDRHIQLLLYINKNEDINNTVISIMNVWKEEDILIWEDKNYYFFSGNDIAAILSVVLTLLQNFRGKYRFFL